MSEKVHKRIRQAAKAARGHLVTSYADKQPITYRQKYMKVPNLSLNMDGSERSELLPYSVVNPILLSTDSSKFLYKVYKNNILT